MEMSIRRYLVLLIVAAAVLLAAAEAEAARPMEGEVWWRARTGLAIQSLQRGRPSGRSPCTYIPGQGTGTCSLNGRNFAGQRAKAEGAATAVASPPPPPPPSGVLTSIENLRMASNVDHTSERRDPSS